MDLLFFPEADEVLTLGIGGVLALPLVEFASFDDLFLVFVGATSYTSSASLSSTIMFIGTFVLVVSLLEFENIVFYKQTSKSNRASGFKEIMKR